MKLIRDTATYIAKYKFLSLLFFFGAVLTLLPFIFDGQIGCVNGTCGFIIGTNYRDGIWFQAVAATSFQTFPFQLPNFAGAALSGYHFLPNLAAYIFTFVGIPIAFTYYKLIPILYFLGLTVLVVQLGKRIMRHPLHVGILMFLTYFGMHLSLVTSLLHSGTIKNQVLINTFQATRILESPHTALALLMLFSLIIILTKRTKTLHDVISLGILLFIALGTKVYVAFSMATILFSYETFTFILRKKIRPLLVHGLIYMVFGLCAVFIFYNPFGGTGAGSTFIFSPFATVHHLIESPDLFYSQNLVLARYYLYEHGWSPRLFLIEIYSSALFFLFYFGTRIIGIFKILTQAIKRKINILEASIVFSIFSSMIVSILFIQKGDWFNPIQFAVPAAYLMSIFAAKALFDIIQRNKIVGYSILGVVVLITFPANLMNLSYLSNPGRFVLPQKEVDALKYLKSQEDGTVYAPIDENDMAYVSAFTGKQTYINFLSVLGNSGQDTETRLEKIRDPQALFQQKNIRYLYLPKNSKEYSMLSPLCNLFEGYEMSFENEMVLVCKKTSL